MYTIKKKTVWNLKEGRIRSELVLGPLCRICEAVDKIAEVCIPYPSLASALARQMDSA